MTQQVLPEVQQLFDQWKSEHAALDQHEMELIQWVHDQSRQRDQQYRDAVAKVHELNQRLAQHFVREGEICSRLYRLRGAASEETRATIRQTAKDHDQILCRLKQLADRMQEARSELDAWKNSMAELNLIIDLIEQHEEQEAESIQWLIPKSSSVG